MGGFFLVAAYTPLHAETREPSNKVREVSLALGREAPEHWTDRALSRVWVERGRELYEQGWTISPFGEKTARQSEHFVCAQCHNADREAMPLKVDADQRLDQLAEARAPLLPGSGLFGVVNRVSWYNGDWASKYGASIARARSDLREAIQLCSVQCSRGRPLEAWEIESLLAFLWSKELVIEDLALSPDELRVVGSALKERRYSARQALAILDEGVPRFSATFVDPAREKPRSSRGNPHRGRQIFEGACLSCHGAAGPSRYRMDTTTGRGQLAQDSRSGALARTVRLGAESKRGQDPYMPPFTRERLSTRELEDLMAFAESGTVGRARPDDDLYQGGSGPSAPQPSTDVESLLASKCSECHGSESRNPDGGFGFVDDLARLASDRRYIVAGAPGASPLYRLVAKDEMPKRRPPLSAGEKGILRAWIEGLSPTSAPDREWITDRKLLQRIRSDLRTSSPLARRNFRYLSLTHLWNQGVDAETLRLYRQAVVKLINSLSWDPRIYVPRTIDPQRTLFRIELDKLRGIDQEPWDEDSWSVLVCEYPYAIALDVPELSEIVDSTGTSVPWIRADWFAAAATLPPLYEKILGLPGTVEELEAILGVNSSLVLNQLYGYGRAGFAHSGVSRHNRLIERFPLRAWEGTYWKSYDFASGEGDRNLFSHPLGPQSDFSEAEDEDLVFSHDGGEMIFNLPNGFQAYFLADDKGQLIDQGPPAIVFDSTNSGPDRGVVFNGISCMGCHFDGIKRKDDEIRRRVRSLLSPSDFKRVEQLYPEPERMGQWIDGDRLRFEEALRAAGLDIPARHQDEPIRALAQRFASHLTTEAVAAELGIQPDEMSFRLGGDLLDIKVALRSNEGVPRDELESKFERLVNGLRLGRVISCGELVGPGLRIDFEKKLSASVIEPGLWIIDGSKPHSGRASLHSPPLAHKRSASFEVNIPRNSTTISFDYFVSAESDCHDYLSVSISDVELLQLCETAEQWRKAKLDLVPGEGTRVRFSYRKDGYIKGGEDRVWIDNIEIE